MYVRDVEAALSAAAKNRYWREGDAELVLSLFRDSGQTLGVFGRQWGINVARLRRWQRRLGERELPTFHPVSVVPQPSFPAVRMSEDVGGVEVGLRGGRRVVARPGFDEATLVRVIRVLEDLAC